MSRDDFRWRSCGDARTAPSSGWRQGLLAGRRDTPFWRHASAPERCSERLHHLLAIWQLRPPSFADFSLRYPPFNHLNYEFILFGSNWRPESAPCGVGTAAPDADLARRTSRLIAALPDNAQALRALHG